MKTTILAGLLLTLSISAHAQDASTVLKEMDDAMNFDEGVMVLSFEDVKADGKGRTLKATVLYSLKDGTLLEFIAPEREKGKRILMIGDSMWMGTATVSKPIRLSGKDTFMGTSFSNDDVMNFDKSDDYDPRIVSFEAGIWTLELIARKKNLPYPRMVITVGENRLPLAMRMYALSGLETKRIEFSDVKPFGGKPRPSLMTIIDSMTSGNRTMVRFESIQAGKVDRTRLSPSGFMK